MKNKQIRCAIYTRKSSEEGLEQDFNSLDAQREAGEAYIKSQMHEGWVLIDKQYNDGGFSGGTMQRPAFKELMNDIENDEVDIVVVYKVDRLTRSLMDFAKIVDVFDKHETSFVSITQHFNTTTSMGRLTLNILLSFAQFEREVTGERIRDKFAASKKKGMWMTGIPPMGYVKKDGKLEIDNAQAKIIQQIFGDYLDLKTVPTLQNHLKANKVHTRTGKVFTKGHLYKILSNKTYIGKIVHKTNVYGGLHVPIIEYDVFNKVQKLLQENSIERKNATNAQSGSLLAKKLFDDKGNYMSPSHSNKKGKRYRYYVSQAQLQNRKREAGSITKVSAPEIEKHIKTELAKFIQDKENIREYFNDIPVAQQKIILNNIADKEFDTNFIRHILFKATISKDKIAIILYKTRVKNAIEYLIYGTHLPEEKESDVSELINIQKNVRMSGVTSNGSKLIIGDTSTPVHNMQLINAIVKSFYYHKLIQEGRPPEELKTSSYARRIVQLRFLPPKLIEDILNGTQSPDLTVVKLFQTPCGIK
jgi:DNA invertase Pin-like site-specific DNA recombinase